MPIVVIPASTADWAWAILDVDDVEHGISNPDSIVVGDGVAGALMPPVSVAERELPLRAGSARQGVRVASRPFDLPLAFLAPDAAVLASRIEQFLQWCDPTVGTVALRVTRPDSTRRELVATYEGGLEGDESSSRGVRTAHLAVARFRAHEPYWRDVDETEVAYTVSSPSGTWFPLAFPIQFASSQVVASPTVVNGGSAESWPVWTITGPGANPVLRNLTTGTHLGLSKTLVAGEVVTIDTTPLASNPVRDAGGNNLFPLLTAGSERWSLARGLNRLQIEMTGATADSSIVLAYRRRWLRR